MIYVNIIILPKLAHNQNTEHWHLFYNGLQSIVKHFMAPTTPSNVSGSGLLGVIEKDRDQSWLNVWHIRLYVWSESHDPM